MSCFFSALHEMQMQSSDENSVHLSVCLSDKRVHCDKMEEKSVHIFISCKRSFSLVFWEEEWFMGATPSTWNFGSFGPLEQNRRFWTDNNNNNNPICKVPECQKTSVVIFARISSVVTLSEKSSINTIRNSAMPFPMSHRWSSYVALKSPKGALKNAKLPISV